MRRIGRYILNGLTVLSLVLCMATVGLWVRSYGIPQKLQFSRSGVLWEVASDHGRLTLDNAPQRTLESERTSREWADLMRECVRLSRQAAALKVGTKQRSEDEPTDMGAERSQLLALIQANAKARAAMYRKPPCATARFTRRSKR